MAYTATMAMSTHQPYHVSESIAFDTDSQLVGIDNRCSACITHVCEDMPGELIPCHQSIKGFGALSYGMYGMTPLNGALRMILGLSIP